MSELQKQELTSKNIKEEQLLKLKELFPEVFTEGMKVDWEKLRLTLGEEIDAGKERYGMNWPGKADCFKTIQQPSIATLIPARDESIDFDKTQNLFIEGDNLEILKLLQKSYLGNIKMMYFDPPYNTGGDFIYPDNYNENLQTYLEYTGQIDSEGRKFGTNPDTDGRFHSKWMNMMYPRLFLAKNLLREDGVIFISIDDNEVENLKKICNEVFGEENFIEQICWKNKYGAGAKTRGFISVHEYILCYSKTKLSNIEAPLDEEDKKKYSNVDEKFNIRGGYITQPLMTTSMGDRKNLQYSIFYKDEEIKPEKQWVWEKDRLLKAIKNNEVVIKKMNDGKFSVRSKQYLKNENGIIRKGKPISILNGPFNQEGTSEVKSLFGREVFSFPKPSNLLKYLFSFVINEQNDTQGIYLDIFAGSCTSAHALIELNKIDNGKRKFICIQLPELIENNPEITNMGLKTIADVGKERIRKVISKIKKELKEETTKSKETLFDKQQKTELDLGFKVYKLAQSNFKTWDSTLEKSPEVIQQKLFEHINHISPEAAQEAILYELLLKSGFELTTKIEKLTLAGKTVFSIAEGQLLICLEKELTHECLKAMAEMQPIRVICLDEAFKGVNADALKTNAVQIMKSKGVVNFRTV